MEKSPGRSTRTLIITVVVGVVLLHAALFTALAFRSNTPSSSALPPLPASLGATTTATPQPAPPPAAQTTRPNPEPLRASPPGPVGMATDDRLPSAKGLTGGGKALGQ
jgi:flagellar basal body-associated protein FliL